MVKLSKQVEKYMNESNRQFTQEQLNQNACFTTRFMKIANGLLQGKDPQ